MNRIKNAWLVLIGKAQALEITQETAAKWQDMARRVDGPLDSVLDEAHEVYEEEVGSDVESMIRERNVVKEAQGIVTNAAKGI